MIASTFVKVKPNGNQLLKHINWWLSVKDAFLFGPTSTAFVGHSLFNRNAQILMKCDCPISVRGLFEICTLDGAMIDR